MRLNNFLNETYDEAYDKQFKIIRKDCSKIIDFYKSFVGKEYFF
jgi:hypothetical protein